MSVMHFANALVWEIIGPAMAGPTGPCATPLWYDTIIASGLERVKVYTAEKRRAVHLTGARERGKMDRQEWQGEGEDVHTEWCQRRCVVRVPGQRGQQGWTRTCVRFFALSQIRSDQFSFYLLRLFLYENSALNFFTVFFSVARRISSISLAIISYVENCRCRRRHLCLPLYFKAVCLIWN